jgi:hypothetical protein
MTPPVPGEVLSGIPVLRPAGSLYSARFFILC